MLAVASNDIEKIVSVMMSIAIQKGIVDRNVLYEDMSYLLANYLYMPLENIKISVFINQVFDIARRNNLSMPKEFTLLVRGMIIIEGVVSELSPEINFLDLAVPYISNYSTQEFFKSLTRENLLREGYNFAKNSYQLPNKLSLVLDGLINGRTKLKLQHMNLEKPTSEINKMVNRIVFALIISSMIMGSSMILNSSVGPKIYGLSILGLIGFAVAGVMGILLMASILKSGNL